MQSERIQLVDLLRSACEEMLRYGDATYLGEFSDCRSLGQYLRTAADEIRAGNDEKLQGLWVIFAPTCDWDDAGGSLETGNAAFAILDRMHNRHGLD